MFLPLCALLGASWSSTSISLWHTSSKIFHRSAFFERAEEPIADMPVQIAKVTRFCFTDFCQERISERTGGQFADCLGRQVVKVITEEIVAVSKTFTVGTSRALRMQGMVRASPSRRLASPGVRVLTMMTKVGFCKVFEIVPGWMGWAAHAGCHASATFLMGPETVLKSASPKAWENGRRTSWKRSVRRSWTFRRIASPSATENGQSACLCRTLRKRSLR